MSLILQGSTSGSVTLQEPAVAGTTVLTLPATSGNVVVDSATQTLTNKTIQGGTITSGTAVASTSGTSIDFTSIPSWVKRVTVMFSGVSTNGTSSIRVQIGTSVGVIVSGYLGSATTLVAGVSTSNFTAGFDENTAGGATAASIRHGFYSINMLSATRFVCTGILNYSDEARSNFLAGSVTISGTLDRVRITTVNGTDTFDAGTINILYE
jgi:hypothetical protein